MLYALDQAGKSHCRFMCWTVPILLPACTWKGRCLTPRKLRRLLRSAVRHGLTLGELATMANAEKDLGADLHVIKMKDWYRGDWFDSTGLTWTDPSPNLRSLNAATLYPGVAMLESSPNYSVGRGTDAPFEQIGADWIHGASSRKR